MADKYTAPWKHAGQRLWERYKLSISKAEYIKLCEAIACGRWAYSTVRTSGHRHTIKFLLGNRRVYAIWDTLDEVIVTFQQSKKAPKKRTRPRRDGRKPKKARGGAKNWRVAEWE